MSLRFCLSNELHADMLYSIEDTDKDGRTPIMIAAMLNKHRKLDILVDTYTSWSILNKYTHH